MLGTARRLRTASDVRRWYETAHSRSAFRARCRFYGLIRAMAKGRYLDLSCGEGHAFPFGSGVGTDFSLVALRRAKERSPDSDLVSADSQNIPFANGIFHSLSCLGSLEHFRDPVAALAEIRRVMAAGGLALISVPNRYRWTRPGSIIFQALRRPASQPIDRNYSVSEFSNLLSQNGFSLVKVLNPSQFELSDRGLPEWIAEILGTFDRMLHPMLAIEPLYICVKNSSACQPGGSRGSKGP